MGKPVQVVALPPDDALVFGVHRIANALNKRRGYSTTIPVTDVKTVMEAVFMMVQQAREKIKDDDES